METTTIAAAHLMVGALIKIQQHDKLILVIAEKYPAW